MDATRTATASRVVNAGLQNHGRYPQIMGYLGHLHHRSLNRAPAHQALALCNHGPHAQQIQQQARVVMMCRAATCPPEQQAARKAINRNGR